MNHSTRGYTVKYFFEQAFLPLTGFLAKELDYYSKTGNPVNDNKPYREIVLDDDDVVVRAHEVSDGPGRVQPLLHVEVRRGLVEHEDVRFLQ